MEWNATHGLGFRGAALSWARLERILSGKKTPELRPLNHLGEVAGGGDAAKYVRYYSRQPFVELHGASSYNFLRGAAEPERMARAAVECGLTALSLLDRDGFYGVVAASEAADKYGLNTVFGAELSLDHAVLPVLCKNPTGYRNLSKLITQAQLCGDKDTVRYPPLDSIAHQLAGSCYVLAGPEWFERIDQVVAAFGATDVLVEYVVGMCPEDADNFEQADAIIARIPQLKGVATTRACAAYREDVDVAQAKQALASKSCVAGACGQLHPMGATWLRSGDVVLRAVGEPRKNLLDQAVAVAEECAFGLELVAPQLPNWDVPAGHDEASWLAETVWRRFKHRYANRPRELVDRARNQVEYELSIINQLGFPGYFLIVSDLVDFAKDNNILCQGRGSAANSAVCFALGITNVEPISAGLLFERFLSPEREGPPDIDIDFESGRREEVIQYVYQKYGRKNAAQVANVITYRKKGAIRDAARALGYPQGVIDSWSRGLTPPVDVERLAAKLRGHPRHLGIHSGGMVMCDREVAEVVPIEWARKEDRSVIQWDKEGCAAAGLVKFDLLGLGMLEALHHMIDLVAETTGKTVELWELDTSEAAVYEMLSAGDAIGVFQVESRAQLSTLPRMKPACFFDLVVEVALIRPGPIQGGSVHPYLRRRSGEEPITFEHPILEKSLAKTLGVPLFQEQLMQVAVDAAGFSGGEADELRRAMGSKRSPERMARMKARFFTGLAETSGIVGDIADSLWNKIIAFAAYGFPESHSQSFASLVFFSAWFKLHYPAEFCVGLLRAQPMGFYSPQSLLADARRHGVKVLPISINDSEVEASIETAADGTSAIRLGLNLVNGISCCKELVQYAPYTDIADIVRKVGVNVAQLEALARAGALECLGVDRRQALWQAGIAATERADMLPGLSVVQAPTLPGMNAFELLVHDIATTGVSHDKQPMEFLRETLAEQGVVPAEQLLSVADGTRIYVAGVVTHRQRPQTAGKVTFLGMEDETGLMNIVLSHGLWQRQKKIARTATVLKVRGIVHNANGVASITADQLTELNIGKLLNLRSRDFR
ncbi:MAG: error-prone DNA polymerase [Corynebacterium sp.]|uniref:error-prone DNA polymerase n=1 Tax=Corynebacterium sp. TaxID=1720 RepID=UPI0026DCB4B3|nr:error-prone DNA polymerase [Corynebacterium sp.]MDO5099744.1 error-prone DNA polymerase [Corynebacterium sp.]